MEFTNNHYYWEINMLDLSLFGIGNMFVCPAT